MIVIIHLHGIHRSGSLQIDLYPFSISIRASHPECLTFLIRQVGRKEIGGSLGTVRFRESLRGGSGTLRIRGSFHRLFIRKQHPPRKLSFLSRLGGSVMRIITEVIITIHNALLIEESRIHAEATLPIHRSRERHRGEMPIITSRPHQGTSVSGTIHETTGLIAYRVMRLVFIRT